MRPRPRPQTGFEAQVSVTVEKEVDGSQNVFAFFVDESLADGPGPLTACVEHYLDAYDSVSCFGYSSEESFTAAQIDEEQGTAEYSCWVASMSINKDGEARRQMENADYDDENCPAAP